MILIVLFFAVTILPKVMAENNLKVASLIPSLNGWQIVAPIIFADTIDSKTAKAGDVIEGRVLEDIRFGNYLIANKDSLIRGHIIACGEPRRRAVAIVSSERRMKWRGFIQIQFDEIVDKEKCIFIQGIPCKQKTISQDTGSQAQALEVDAEGRIIKSEETLTGSMKMASVSTQVAASVPVPGNIIFGKIAAPIVMGAIGAASPSIAYSRPIADDESSHIKGMMRGIVNGLPGVPLIRKGNDVIIFPADQIMINICFKDTGYRLPSLKEK
jgi:hypothetical protein